jgi:Flp pilus assembly protein TadG
MRKARSVFQRSVARGRRAARDVRGAQLLELALVLPLLLILAVGILDFGTAYNLRQILNNGAREGARIGAAQPGIDLNCGASCLPAPGSVQAVYNDVVTYLQNARVDTSFIGSSPSYSPNDATWTYPCAAKTCGPVTAALTIQRRYPVLDPVSGGSLISTHVTLSYPYNWLYGFNNIISFFGVKYGGTIAITTDALMQNQN